MSLTQEQLLGAADLIASALTLREAAAQWRERNPGVRALVVDAINVRGETAALQFGARAIYLATSNGHCWSITQLPEQADAVILTQR